MEGEAEIAKTLVKLGASVGYLNRQKKTAVDAAKEKFHHDLAAWLQAEGAEAAHCLRCPPDPKETLFFLPPFPWRPWSWWRPSAPRLRRHGRRGSSPSRRLAAPSPPPQQAYLL